MKSPIKTLEEYGLTLFNPEGADLIETYADIALDDRELLGEIALDIPVTRTLAAAVSAVSTFRDYILIKKWIAFQKEFQAGTVSEEALRKRKDAAEKREQWVMREIELLLTRIDSINDKRNVEILSRVYIAYLNRECSWELFEETAQILERFIYSDGEQLKRIYDRHSGLINPEDNKTILTMSKNNYCDRLVALGLVWQKFTNVLNGGVNVDYHLTEAGLLLARAL